MGSVRFRLSLMMFLQYFVWGAWVVAIGGYMPVVLKFDADKFGWIFSTTAIGAIISPLLVGYIADRFFSTERVLAVLHAGGAVCLFLSATVQEGEFAKLMTLMVLNGVFYMPTLALTNSISFRNIGDPEREFPMIRVWGTIGWIVAGLIVGIVLGGTTKLFFYLAGGAAAALAAQCLTLPHTPPKAEESEDVLGLGAIKLVREPSFAVFVIISFLIMTPMFFYYSFANTFLVETDQPVPTAIQTIGQVCEIFFLISMPFFIKRLGIKYMIILGMAAWVIRYFCFASIGFPLILLGLILHGICYDFFFVASQIYVDKKAPRDLRASAQSFIAFVSLGLGALLGTKLSGYIVGIYPPVTVAATDHQGEPKPQSPLPTWEAPETDIPARVQAFLFGEDAEKTPPPYFAERNDANKDGKIQRDEIPPTWTEEGDTTTDEDDVHYDGEELLEKFDDIDALGEKNGDLTKHEWRKAQGHRWENIWYWPALMALGITVFFWLAFHDKKAEIDGEPPLDETPPPDESPAD